MGKGAGQAVAPLITGEELQAMGDIGPCELIDGKIVPMSPTGGEHGRIELHLGSALHVFVQQRHLGWVLTGEVGIYTRRNPDRIRGADIVFLSRQNWLDGPPSGFLDRAPDLVVEIMSPNDRWQDIRQKLSEYFTIGVHWVWIVEPDNRAIAVFHSTTDLQQLSETETLKGEGLLEGFTLEVGTLFTV